MGKIPQGILGGVSGKVGGVVGSSWKGINVVKTIPLSVANPRTAGQIAQRSAFSLTVQDATALLSTVVKPLWDRFSVKMSGFNSFIKANIEIMGAAGPISETAFVISKGKLQAPIITDASNNAVNPGINLTWDENSTDPYALPTDEVYVVVRKFKEGNELAEGIKLAETRRYGEGFAAFSKEILSGDLPMVYMAFRRADGTMVSNTGWAQSG